MPKHCKSEIFLHTAAHVTQARRRRSGQNSSGLENSMKHDPQLKRLLLLQLRDGGLEKQIESYPAQLVLEQKARLIEEGLATGTPIKDGFTLKWVKALEIAAPGHQWLEELEAPDKPHRRKQPSPQSAGVLDRRYQVFVSSTFDDLKDERQAVMTALLKTFCIPTGMELFPASDAEQWQVIERVIDDCDYYIVIVAGKYGTLDEQTGISFTEREFDYAVQTKKPVLAFYHRNISAIRSDKVEDTDIRRASLKRFTEKVKKQRMCEGWEAPAELGSAVKSAIINQLKNNPQPGWVRANTAQIESVGSPTRKERKDEIVGLREQGKELFDLSVEVYSDADAPLVRSQGKGRQFLFKYILSMPLNALLLKLGDDLGHETTSGFVQYNRSDSLVHEEMKAVVARENPKYREWFRCILEKDEISRLFHIWNEQGIIRITSIERSGSVAARLDRKGFKVLSKLTVLTAHAADWDEAP